MLTRLQIDGFKNLVGVDLRLGPITCIAGANGVGKSNLFDAITFLSSLASQPLMEAAASVRGEPGHGSSGPETLFHRVGDSTLSEMRFSVEMLVPKEAEDDLGQLASATNTFLTYTLWLGLRSGRMEIAKEELGYITLRDAPRHLQFRHTTGWRNSVLKANRRAPFISTDRDRVLLHQDQPGSYRGGGRPRPHVARQLPRTVLSTALAAESKTAVAAKKELQSWQLLQLEPSALREPDGYSADRHLGRTGEHLPATLARLMDWKPEVSTSVGEPSLFSGDNGDVCGRVAARLAELIDGVRSVRLDDDARRELLSIWLTDTSDSEFEARSLSDGTLRFLALAILENDPDASGLWCLEEPENGIHPERIPAMVRLLRDLAVDPTLPVDETNPLRQVILNTHSPKVVAFSDENDVILVIPQSSEKDGDRYWRPSFRSLQGTWREKAQPDRPTASPGAVRRYLDLQGSNEYWSLEGGRVVDRPEIQAWLPGLGPVSEDP